VATARVTSNEIFTHLIASVRVTLVNIYNPPISHSTARSFCIEHTQLLQANIF